MAANTRQHQVLTEMETRAVEFFEPKLASLGLSVPEIEKQTLQELEESLDRIADAMRYPEQFGTLRLSVKADAGVIVAQARSESIVEVGILPVLLERKKIILDRIKVLKPEDQLDQLSVQIATAIKDPAQRENLLKAVDRQRRDNKVFAQRIEAEARQVGEALDEERFAIGHSVALAKLEVRIEATNTALQSRVDSLEKSLVKLEDKVVSKFDVATTVFLILASLGGLVGAIAALMKWLIP